MQLNKETLLLIKTFENYVWVNTPKHWYVKFNIYNNIVIINILIQNFKLTRVISINLLKTITIPIEDMANLYAEELKFLVEKQLGEEYV